MKLNFLKQKPNISVRQLKFFFKTKVPVEQRLTLFNGMWNGTDIKNLSLIAKPFKIMFEDANKMAKGRAWDNLIAETQEYIKNKTDNTVFEKYLLKIVYKNEPDKQDFLNKFFKEKDWKQFEDIILKDILESKEKEYQDLWNKLMGEEENDGLD
jgi:hypothetical protein